MNAELCKCITDWLSFFHPKFSDIADLQSMKELLDSKLPLYEGTLRETTKEIIQLIDNRLKELTLKPHEYRVLD